MPKWIWYQVSGAVDIVADFIIKIPKFTSHKIDAVPLCILTAVRGGIAEPPTVKNRNGNLD